MKTTKMDIDTDADDQDPVTASYPVFLNPALPLGRRLLVLQHPNRTDDASSRPPPSELRLKSASGMVEVDVPLETGVAYDREKGLAWGRALHSSMAAKSGGSHGLAGGFGFGAVAAQRAARRRGVGEGEDEALGVLDWNEAVRQDKVLRTQTLGGQYPDSNEVQYMVGVFKGKHLHLTPVSSLVLLRPQLHHIDAATQQERSATAAVSTKDGAAASTAAVPAARAIHMTIKTTSDGDTLTTETMADRLRSVQSEPWRKMRYTDENDEAAWDVYNESLFLKSQPDESQPAPKPPSQQMAPPQSLDECVPAFAAKWTDKQFLEAVSGITKSDPLSVQDDVKPEHRDMDPETAPKNDRQAQKSNLNARAPATAPAPRRAGRSKSSSTSINID
ncbi:hypothetical protein CDD81_4615 [Ophiocordyceps australis]|uniref:DNA-directed RNA polymerase III subunit Rpc5 n=1 Tax=Ophiocordyceps australis TaxID=1399860 RepID=A0A2C5YBQ4_9HYPO|nr:hypothetical protein CDD81_4615 [Ophiocordyceps australis]